MVEIIPIRDGDYEYVKANCVQQEVKDYPTPVIPDNSFTALFEGRVVAVGGIRLFLPGVGEGWIMLHAQARTDGVFGIIACRAIRDKLDSLSVELGLRRCEVQVRADFPKALRFVEAMGFENPYERRFFFPDGTSSMLYEKLYMSEL
jgi:hypothetical protein